MADYTRNLPADAVNFTTVDNNAKSEAGAGPPMVQVAPEGDEFGAALDGNWVEITGTEINAAWSGKSTASIAEGGNKLNWTDGAVPWCVGERRNIAYKDCDLEIEFDPTNAAVVVGKVSLLIFAMWKDEGNFVRITYMPRRNVVNQKIDVYKYINSAATLLAEFLVGTQDPVKLRIKRVAATNTFTLYYDIGAGWVQLWTGVVSDATHFPVNADLYPIVAPYESTETGAFNPSCDFYRQKTDGGIAAQRFWPDSPEADIKDSVNCGGGESYAFDAAVDKTWVLTGASSVEDGDGGTNKWKVGFSDNPDGSGITWDGAWRTIAEVNTNAGNGDYDGHRYLYIKWQGNSDNTQQPNATSFTISGTAAGAGIASSIFESSVFKSGVFR